MSRFINRPAEPRSPRPASAVCGLASKAGASQERSKWRLRSRLEPHACRRRLPRLVVDIDGDANIDGYARKSRGWHSQSAGMAREYQRGSFSLSPGGCIADFGSEEEGVHMDMESYPRYCSATQDPIPRPESKGQEYISSLSAPHIPPTGTGTPAPWAIKCGLKIHPYMGAIEAPRPWVASTKR